jgi:peptidoglycan/LPS O-acetylase OafA/YrhL
MVHQPILRVMNTYLGDVMVAHPVLMYGAFWMSTIAFSAALYHLIETPCRKIARQRFSGTPVKAPIA